MQLRPPLRIAIIECDKPGFKSINDRGDYGGMFTKLLQDAAPAGELKKDDMIIQVHNVVDNTTDYPDLENIDAVLLSGSSELRDFCLHHALVLASIHISLLDGVPLPLHALSLAYPVPFLYCPKQKSSLSNPLQYPSTHRIDLTASHSYLLSI